MNARDLYYWPGMKADIATSVASCDACAAEADSLPLEPEINTIATEPMQMLSLGSPAANSWWWWINFPVTPLSTPSETPPVPPLSATPRTSSSSLAAPSPYATTVDHNSGLTSKSFVAHWGFRWSALRRTTRVPMAWPSQLSRP